MTRSAPLALALALALSGELRATAQGAPPAEAPLPAPPLKDIGFDQKIGDQVPLDLAFRDEAGGMLPYLKAMRPHQWLKK